MKAYWNTTVFSWSWVCVLFKGTSTTTVWVWVTQMSRIVTNPAAIESQISIAMPWVTVLHLDHWHSTYSRYSNSITLMEWHLCGSPRLFTLHSPAASVYQSLFGTKYAIQQKVRKPSIMSTLFIAAKFPSFYCPYATYIWKTISQYCISIEGLVRQHQLFQLARANRFPQVTL